MNELDSLAESELEDSRKYEPRRDYYETALDEAFEHGDFDSLDEVKDMISRSIKSGSPIGKTALYRKTRRTLRDLGYSIPPKSPLHREGQ